MDIEEYEEEAVKDDAIEIEADCDEDEYRNSINESTGPIYIGDIEFEPAEVLYEMDPVAYRVGLADYCSELEPLYECPECGDVHDNENDAVYCCQEDTIKMYRIVDDDGEIIADGFSDYGEALEEMETMQHEE